uniref:Uncharacterized protein n=1 Tax=Siphoviridae sp. ctiJm4 TaxID=2827916 RepID=A0A8S5T1S5_9CAUD|nr:MAG TPA: hypothetical protein [Siphoviridae sp. ctiJm4]
MITVTQKEFDLLQETAKHQPTEAKPFKMVSVKNGAVAGLTSQGLVDSRPKEGNALMLELAITQLGYQVVNNEIAHEITTGSEQAHTNENPTKEEHKMEETKNSAELSKEPTSTGYVYQLEDNIPIPEVIQVRKSRESTMPLERMNVGQSFLVPFKDGEDQHKGRKRVAATVSQTRKRKLGADSTAQFITVIVENGYRVWRKA